MEDLIIAKKALDTGYTCVLSNKGLLLTSKDDLEKALNDFINSKIDFKDFSIAITYINESIFLLIDKLEIKKIYTYELSNEVKKILDERSILYKYAKLLTD